MKIANIITITNRSKNPVSLKSDYVDEEIEENNIKVNPSSFRLLDYKKTDSQIDIDEMYLQFDNDENKIKIEDSYKYGIYIEYQLL